MIFKIRRGEEIRNRKILSNEEAKNIQKYYVL